MTRWVGNVYVAGTITHPGVFGTLDVATDGMFTAKLVTPVEGDAGDAGRDE